MTGSGPRVRREWSTVTPETGKPVASEVVINKTAPLEKAELNGICASCGKTALLGAGDLCRPCWSADDAAMVRCGHLKGSPSAVYDLVHRAPEPDELKPHPTGNGREWTDPTGTLGEAFADNSLPLEMAMAAVSLVPEDLIVRWRAAGLNHREVAVMLANEAGL